MSAHPQRVDTAHIMSKHPASKARKGASGTSNETKPGVRTGTPVKIRGGAFCGHVGFLEERKPHRLALVWIQMLGRPVCVEIEPYNLDVLN